MIKREDIEQFLPIGRGLDNKLLQNARALLDERDQLMALLKEILIDSGVCANEKESLAWIFRRMNGPKKPPSPYQ